MEHPATEGVPAAAAPVRRRPGVRRFAKVALPGVARLCLALMPAGMLVGAAQPVPAAEVRSAAERAGLELGVAIAADIDARRTGLVAGAFTSVTPENALKWRQLAPSPGVYDFADADAIVDSAARSGLRVRGHTLIWSRLNGLPRWLSSALMEDPDPAATMLRLLRDHVATVVGRYRGRIAEWDVVNEPLSHYGPGLDRENPVLRLIGEAGLVAAFKAAAAADPAAKLYLNEIFAEHSERRFDAIAGLAQRLRVAGAPVHGVGLQGHFRAPPDVSALAARFARLGELGFEVEITELDIPIQLFPEADDPLGAQAEAYAAVVGSCLEAPACKGVTLWGLDDGRSWLGARARPLLFDVELAPKPALWAVLETLRAGAR